MRTHVLLLRGVNVGGKNRLAMAGLRELVAELGGEQVATYIQSGNVVCRLSPERAATLPSALTEAMAARFGVRSPVVIRGVDELEAALQAYPWDVPEAERAIAFLADTPSPERAAALDPNRSPGDRWALIGRDVHMHLGHGAADTKLTNDWLDRGLATFSTGRNWRTATTLLGLLRG